MEIEEMEIFKCYHISYGGNTECLVRVKNIDTCQINLISCIHNWNGYESFRKGTYCVKSGIEKIRKASQAEKQSLIRFELENDLH